MKSSLLLCLVPGSLAATLYLAGDSTMAAAGGGSGTDGWGQYVSSDVSVTVSNKAIGGRSARSYTREGRFQAIADVLQPGDYVVIEFGHNDGGSLSTDNGRTDCPGTGGETCETVYNGVAETVLTFPAYLENASKLFLNKGAHVLISSQTPNNPWESGSFVYQPSRFVGYAELAAQVAGVDYVDHGAYVASIFETLGAATVDSYFPNDHTHTSPEGAQVVADAFLKAVACSDVALKSVLTTTDFPGECL
ncbi:SGNH hydrolase-type esterase domain-containing protein [Aspergillus floccosus]